MRDDITGRIAGKVELKFSRFSDAVNKKVPLGPDRVEVTDKEFMQQYNSMSPQQRQQLAQEMGGVETTLEMLDAGQA